jgi:hypothetical protein
MAPPEKKPNMGMYDKAIKEIERRHGQWARVRVFTNNQSAYSASGALKKKLDMKHWDVQIGKQEDDTFGLFLRYNRDGKK